MEWVDLLQYVLSFLEYMAGKFADLIHINVIPTWLFKQTYGKTNFCKIQLKILTQELNHHLMQCGLLFLTLLRTHRLSTYIQGGPAWRCEGAQSLPLVADLLASRVHRHDVMILQSTGRGNQNVKFTNIWIDFFKNAHCYLHNYFIIIFNWKGKFIKLTANTMIPKHILPMCFKDILQSILFTPQSGFYQIT